MTLIDIPVLFFSIVLHEYAHGWMALRCGDPTAKQAGRLTLNPIAHVDPVGSIIVPILLKLSGGVMFGWAKPVPVNPYFFRDPARDNVKVSFAGPASNLILSVVFAASIVLVVHLVPNNLSAVKDALLRMGHVGVFINVILAFFNLMPIPPLDGSHILEYFLPPHLAEKYAVFQRYGFIILIIVIMSPLKEIFFTPAVMLNNMLLSIAYMFI